MVYGICKYCGKYKQLCSAHIIPKSFYNLKQNKKFIGLSNDGTKDLKTCQNGLKDDSKIAFPKFFNTVINDIC